MAEPKIADTKPIGTDVEAGKTYFWCACGNSQNQPFCDGSHRGSEFSPVPFTPEETTTAFLCMCKCTGNQPYCDGTHKQVST